MADDGGGGGGAGGGTLAGSVHLPGVGEVKKSWLAIGGAVVVGILGYAYWRNRSNVTADAAPTDPALGDPLASGATTTGGLTFQPGDPPDPATLPPVDNAAWVQRAIAYLETINFDGATVASALGKYLARQPLNSAEADIVRTAQGAIGLPPVGSYQIIMTGTPPPPPPPDPPVNNPPPPVNNPPPPPSAPAPVYVVTARFTKVNPPWNSTLSGIASHEHTTVAALMALNPFIRDPNVIGIGVRIRVR